MSSHNVISILLEVILKYKKQENHKMPDLTQQDQSRLHSMNATTFVSLTSLLPGLPRSPKNQKSKQFDGYFLDEVITFRKKCIEND